VQYIYIYKKQHNETHQTLFEEKEEVKRNRKTMEGHTAHMHGIITMKPLHAINVC
jgi:hypothetical protein